MNPVKPQFPAWCTKLSLFLWDRIVILTAALIPPVKAQFPVWSKKLSVFLWVQIVILTAALIHLDLRARHFKEDRRIHFEEAGKIPNARTYYSVVCQDIAGIARTNQIMNSFVALHGFEVRNLPGSSWTAFTLMLRELN